MQVEQGKRGGLTVYGNYHRLRFEDQVGTAVMQVDFKVRIGERPLSGGEVDGRRRGGVQFFQHALVFRGTGVGAGLGFEAGDEEGQAEEGQVPAGGSVWKNVRTKSIRPLFYQDDQSS